jgi:hypothetical protein
MAESFCSATIGWCDGVCSQTTLPLTSNLIAGFFFALLEISTGNLLLNGNYRLRLIEFKLDSIDSGGAPSDEEEEKKMLIKTSKPGMKNISQSRKKLIF